MCNSINDVCDSLAITCEDRFKNLLQDICKHALESAKPESATNDAQPKKPPTFDETPVASNFLSYSAIDLNSPSFDFDRFNSPDLFDSYLNFVHFLYKSTFPTSTQVFPGSEDRAIASSSTVIPSCVQKTTFLDDSGLLVEQHG